MEDSLNSKKELLVGDEDSLRDKYLVFNLAGQKFAVAIENIKEIIPLPEISPLAGSDDSDRGIFKLRNQTIPLKDTRKLLRLPSLEEEDQKLIELLEEKKLGHIKWIENLEASLLEGKPFTGATDPRKCDFGRWYDNYETDNINLSLFLIQFDYPHKRIHEIGKTLLEQKEKVGVSGTKRELEKLKENEFQTMLKLFEEAPKLIRESHRELAIVYEIDGTVKAITADQVDGIFSIAPEMIQQKETVKEKIPFGVGIARINEKPVTILDLSNLKQSD